MGLMKLFSNYIAIKSSYIYFLLFPLKFATFYFDLIHIFSPLTFGRSISATGAAFVTSILQRSSITMDERLILSISLGIFSPS